MEQQKIQQLMGWTPKVVFQPPPYGNCGQCSVSSITGIPVNLVSEQMGKFKGTNKKEVSWSLRWFGWECSEYIVYERGMVLAELCILDIRVRNRGLHFTVYHRGFIYDSAYGKFPINELKNVGFKIRGYFIVEEP